MALVDVARKIDVPSFTSFQQDIEMQFRNLLVSFYGSDYKRILARGKLAGDGDVVRVLNTIKEIESNLGITIIKSESK